MKLSILDQSPIREGGTPYQAFQETLTLARKAEAMNYNRFWVSEHHNAHCLAGSAPEVLLAAVGAATEQIRIGSGGVMLPYYSAFKVAEAFSVLSNLYPDRIDLGVGRAPGGDMKTAQMLSTDGKPNFERFPQLVEELGTMLRDRDFQPRITPPITATPPIWMLGSSPESAKLAAKLGLPYNFALFINSKIDPRILEYYRSLFEPSEQMAEPQSCLTINVICAETEEEAKQLSLSRDLLFARFATGQDSATVPTVEEAAQYQFSPQEQAFLDNKFRHAAVGSPIQVKQKIDELMEQFGADELMAVTITYDFDARVRSYELLAEMYA
jgi:luciferase family oxidoreductase group 1